MAHHDSSAGAPPQTSRRSRPHGKEPVGREAILAAAGRLFVDQGYAATTTRQISGAVGIKQPSLYYHFPNKAAMLLELLISTAAPSLEHARTLRESESLSPLTRLLQLIRFDAMLLLSNPSNVGALYLLPEVAHPDFAEFRRMRLELRRAYEELLAQTVEAGEAHIPSVERTAALLFTIVEGVILRRVDAEHLDPEATADDIDVAARRILAASDATD